MVGKVEGQSQRMASDHGANLFVRSWGVLLALSCTSCCEKQEYSAAPTDVERFTRSDFWVVRDLQAKYKARHGRYGDTLELIGAKSLFDWNFSGQCKLTYGFASNGEAWIVLSIGADLVARTSDDIVAHSTDNPDSGLLNVAYESIKCVEMDQE